MDFSLKEDVRRPEVNQDRVIHPVSTMGFHRAKVNVARDRNSFGVYPCRGFGPTFTVKTLHISCQSDKYTGSCHKYGGIIIYGRNGQKEWYTANGTHCKSGYVVIMRTDTSEFKELQTRWSGEPGHVHGAIYKKAFGESCNDVNVIGEGFGIIDGEFKIVSSAFNESHGDEYRDNSRDMNPESRRC